MTDAELQGLTAQAFNMAKREMEQHKRFNFLFACHHASEGGLNRMRKVEELIIERLGEGWLNSGRAKDAGFGVLRAATDRMPPDAVVFATISNKFEPTEKLRALPIDQQRTLLTLKSANEYHKLAKRGLFTIHDALVCTAQTPERVCIYTQKLKGDDRPETHLFDQANFGGRMKMFGVEREDAQ